MSMQLANEPISPKPICLDTNAIIKRAANMAMQISNELISPKLIIGV